MKPIDEMNERELLAELLKQQQKGTRNTRILAGFIAALAVVVFIASLILIPKTLDTLAEAQTLINKSQVQMAKVEKTLDEIDIESLNESIESLSEILKPIASLVSGR